MAPHPDRPAGVAGRQREHLLLAAFDAVSEPDAGLVFLAYQQDPRRQFVPIQARLARDDALSAHVEHTAGAVFALPPPAGLLSLRDGGSTRASPRRWPPRR